MAEIVVGKGWAKGLSGDFSENMGTIDEVRKELEKEIEGSEEFRKNFEDIADKEAKRIGKNLLTLMAETFQLRQIEDDLDAILDSYEKTGFVETPYLENYGARKQQYGFFVEEYFLGINAGSKMTHDLENKTKRLYIEAKSSLVDSKASRMSVGEITIENLATQFSAEEEKALAHIAAIKKMQIKMTNLLYFITREKLLDSGKWGIGFEVIKLYTDLYFKKVKDLIESNTMITTKVKKDTLVRNEKTDEIIGRTITWEVRISIGKDAGKQIKKLRTLYLREINLYDEIKSSDTERRRFFGLLSEKGIKFSDGDIKITKNY